MLPSSSSALAAEAEEQLIVRGGGGTVEEGREQLCEMAGRDKRESRPSCGGEGAVWRRPNGKDEFCLYRSTSPAARRRAPPRPIFRFLFAENLPRLD